MGEPVVSHTRWERRLERMFEGRIRPDALPEVFAHLSDCEDCRARYEQYRRLEDALCEGHGPPPVLTEERLGALIQARLQPATAHRRLGRVRATLLVPALAALPVLAMGLVMFLLVRMPPGDEDALVPRGAPDAVGSPTDSPTDSNIGVRALRITPEGAAPAERLQPGDVLTFTYTNTKAELSYLTLLAVPEGGGEIVWYYPRAEDGRSVEVQTDVVDEPLGDGFEVGAAQPEGRYRLVAFFTARPRTGIEVRRALAGVAPDEAVSTLERGGGVGYSTVLELGSEATP
jgi:hypothetical protein